MQTQLSAPEKFHVNFTFVTLDRIWWGVFKLCIVIKFLSFFENLPMVSHLSACFDDCRVFWWKKLINEQPVTQAVTVSFQFSHACEIHQSKALTPMSVHLTAIFVILCHFQNVFKMTLIPDAQQIFGRLSKWSHRMSVEWSFCLMQNAKTHVTWQTLTHKSCSLVCLVSPNCVCFDWLDGQTDTRVPLGSQILSPHGLFRWGRVCRWW